MAIRPLSFRRRTIADRTLRLSQPVPWTSGISLTPLAINDIVTAATSAASANGVGAWVQLFAASATASTDTIAAISANFVTTNASAFQDNSLLVDIGTGASGSESAVIANLAVANSTISNQLHCILLPIRIAGGTRISFRIRGAVASRNLRVQAVNGGCVLFSSPFADRLPTTLDVLGTSTATSAATACGGASGTWTQITASTSQDYQAVILVPSGPGNGTGVTTTTARLDLGVGAGPEVQIGGVYAQLNGTNGFVNPMNSSCPIIGRFVPAGSRLSIRHNLSASASLLCGCVVGVPYA